MNDIRFGTRITVLASPDARIIIGKSGKRKSYPMAEGVARLIDRATSPWWRAGDSRVSVPSANKTALGRDATQKEVASAAQGQPARSGILSGFLKELTSLEHADGRAGTARDVVSGVFKELTSGKNAEGRRGATPIVEGVARLVNEQLAKRGVVLVPLEEQPAPAVAKTADQVAYVDTEVMPDSSAKDISDEIVALEGVFKRCKGEIPGITDGLKVSFPTGVNAKQMETAVVKAARQLKQVELDFDNNGVYPEGFTLDFRV